MNIDIIKLKYYLNKNRNSLFKLKHDSHFLKLLGKNIGFINDTILDNILNDINAIIGFLFYIRTDEGKYNFLLIPKIRQIYFENTYQDILFSDNSYYDKLYLKLSDKEKDKFHLYVKIGYLPTFLKNNLSIIGADNVFNILMNYKFDNKVYEMFLGIFKDDIVKVKGLLPKIKNYEVKSKYFDMLPISEQKRCVRYLQNRLDYIDNSELLPYIIAAEEDKNLISKYYSKLSYKDKLTILENIKYDNDLQIFLLNNFDFNKSEYLNAVRHVLSSINDRKTIFELYKKIDISIVKILQNNVLPNTDDNFYMDPNIDNKIKFGVELECSNKYNDLLLRFKKFDKWNIVSEGSVKNGIEFTSPIYYYDKESLQNLKDMCNFLNKNDFNYSNAAAGHIHFDISIFNNIKELLMFYKIFCNVEDILYLIFNRPNSVIRSNINEYAVPLSKRLNRNIVNSFHPIFSSINQFVSFVHYSQYGRYSSININNVYEKEKNTIEIRIPNIEMNF